MSYLCGLVCVPFLCFVEFERGHDSYASLELKKVQAASGIRLICEGFHSHKKKNTSNEVLWYISGLSRKLWTTWY